MVKPLANQDPLSVLAQLTFGDMIKIAEGNHQNGHNGAAYAAAQVAMSRAVGELSTADIMAALTTLGIMCVMARPEGVVAP